MSKLPKLRRLSLLFTIISLYPRDRGVQESSNHSFQNLFTKSPWRWITKPVIFPCRNTAMEARGRHKRDDPTLSKGNLGTHPGYLQLSRRDSLRRWVRCRTRGATRACGRCPSTTDGHWGYEEAHRKGTERSGRQVTGNIWCRPMLQTICHAMPANNRQSPQGKAFPSKFR